MRQPSPNPFGTDADADEYEAAVEAEGGDRLSSLDPRDLLRFMQALSADDRDLLEELAEL